MFFRTEHRKYGDLPRLSGERGVSLLEVLFSVVVLGIVVVGYISTLGMVVNTSDVIFDANALSALAFGEMEVLRSYDFEEIPFSKPDTAGALEEVPNYFRNILSDSEEMLILSTGDLPGYEKELAMDGFRADDSTGKWVAVENLLTDGVSEGPDADGPYDPDDPGGSGGDGGPDGGGPGGGGPGDLPEGYQYWMVDLGAEYKISRILYDNRFNIHEALGVSLDMKIHSDDVWQRKWRFFFRESELGFGEPFDPRYHAETLFNFFGGEYGSTGINLVWDDAENPLYAGILGVTEIDTYSDFDADFHWPYATEIEVYGFDTATNYVASYSADGVTTYDNVIMYFPNYKNTGYDLARRVYVPAGAKDDSSEAHYDLFRVVLEFYPHQRGRNDEEWMKETWWQEDDDSELSRFTSSFYRDRVTRRDNLPLLPDLPEHIIYGDNEDFYIEYTVPGASEIRFFFSKFDLQPDMSSDYVQFFDAEGVLYGLPAYYGRPGEPFNLDSGNEYPDREIMFSPWVEGDTIVIHFHSDGVLNTATMGYEGFKVARVEIHKPGDEE